jgi:hypothetical protein
MESLAMSQAANFSGVELLRDGRRIEIRAIRPSDRTALLTAVDHTGSRSLYRRFFGAKRGFSEKEISYFLNVDFVNHVALVAVTNEDGREIIVGGGRYVVSDLGSAAAWPLTVPYRRLTPSRERGGVAVNRAVPTTYSSREFADPVSPTEAV